MEECDVLRTYNFSFLLRENKNYEDILSTIKYNIEYLCNSYTPKEKKLKIIQEEMDV